MKIISEGDSWFKYPGLFKRSNIIQWLKRDFDIKDLSSNGDEAGAMLTGEQNKKLIKNIKDNWYDVLLFSGGGNDIVGEFDLFLYLDNGKLNKLNFENKLSLLRCAYIEFNERVLKYSKNTDIQIITHTYDLPVKLGEPFKIFGFKVAGPWIKPFMEKGGVYQRKGQLELMTYMLESYRDMLVEVSRLYKNFHVVDTQGVVQSDEWADELHPNEKGFKKVAKEIRLFISSLF